MDFISTIDIENIRNYINNDKIEVEFRFREYSNSKISINTFNKFQSILREIPNITETTQLYHSIIAENYRKITINGKTQITKYEHKESKYYNTNKMYPFKLSISTETPISQDDFNKIVKLSSNIISNFKLRTSFMFNTYRIDTTKILTQQGVEQGYEIELELMQNFKLDDLNNVLKDIMKKLYDTEYIYTINEYNNVINYYTTKLNITKSYHTKNDNIIDIDKQLYKIRNLHYHDLVYGGLIGNDETAYMVSYKADGDRKTIVFDDIGIWLLSSPYSANLLYKVDNKTKLIYDLYKGYIIECESIPMYNNYANELQKYRYICYGYDILHINDTDTTTGYFNRKDILNIKNADVRNLTYEERWSILKLFVNNFRETFIEHSKILWIGTKTNYYIQDVDRFYNIMNTMFDDLNNNLVPYKTDGLVFTPRNVPYYGNSNIKNRHDIQSLHKRNLVNMSDVCKWKPSNQLTIDFKIIYISKTVANIWINTKDGLKKFIDETNNTNYKYDKTIELDINKYPNYSIIEFEWDDSINNFKPIRIRYDKTEPNFNIFALDNWELIHRPITKETLIGNDLNLMRRYHNVIKRNLFGFKTYVGKTLLDIGSGRGGDVSKWKAAGFDKIIAVEPNQENILELQKRVDLANMTDKVYIVNAKGEDSDIIKEAILQFTGQNKVDVISFMLSLSFFWENKDTYSKLIETIQSTLSNNGQLLIFTIDGKYVKEYYDSGERVFNNDVLQLDINDDSVYIDIKDSIVNKQNEWLVNLEELSNSLKLKQISYTHADEQQFLNSTEKLLTYLYSSVKYEYNGIINNDNKNIKPVVRKIIPIKIKPLIKKDNRIIFDKFRRINTIGDGNCFIHSILYLIMDDYANYDIEMKQNVSRFIRRDLAFLINSNDPYNEGHKVYDRYEYSSLITVEDANDFDSSRYTLVNMMKLLNSDEYLGDEVFKFICDMLMINMYIISVENGKLIKYADIIVNEIYPVIIIYVINNNHYESVVYDNIKVFRYNDEYIQMIVNNINKNI